LSRYVDIVSAGKDHDSLSSALHLEGSEELSGGITLPHNPAATRMSLAEMDPPEWNHVRRALNPTLSPQAVEEFIPRIREITRSFIDRFIETGKCDLVTDICSPIPAVVTLTYLGLPTHEWQRFAIPSTLPCTRHGNPDIPNLNIFSPNSIGYFPQSGERLPFAGRLLARTSYHHCSHVKLMAYPTTTSSSSRPSTRCWLRASIPLPHCFPPPLFI